MHQPSEQLALFTFEAIHSDSVTIPRRWQKTYKSWRGEFEVIRDRFVGKLRAQYFDFSIEIYDLLPSGSCETVVEITAPLPSQAEALFRRTVDKLADVIASIPCSSVTESLVLDITSNIDSVTAINIYKAKGTARGDRKYFRYSYKEIGKVKHVHIGGGNIHSVVAQSRMQVVKDALAASVGEIKEFSEIRDRSF